MSTATEARVDVSNLLGCHRHRWCIGSYNRCGEDPNDVEYLAIHHGRASTANGLSVMPYQFDRSDGTPYSGPCVQFNGCPNGRVVAEIGVVDAREAAAVLIRFAAGDVPVGSTARFFNVPNLCTEGASVTITRDPDESWCYSRRGLVRTYTSVRITVDNPAEEEDELEFEFDGPTAAQFARELFAITREMAA